jgi:hypothetical protein
VCAAMCVWRVVDVVCCGVGEDELVRSENFTLGSWPPTCSASEHDAGKRVGIDGYGSSREEGKSSGQPYWYLRVYGIC